MGVGTSVAVAVAVAACNRYGSGISIAAVLTVSCCSTKRSKNCEQSGVGFEVWRMP